MASSTALYHLIVEGYRFCRSDGEPFDLSVMTYVPPKPAGVASSPPYATLFVPRKGNDEEDDDNDDETVDLYHKCELQTYTDPNLVEPAVTKPFILAHRCGASWNTLSEQQKDVIKTIESEVQTYRNEGIYFRSAIMEGPGGCGKTRLMAYVMNHSPDNTHVMYLTKQNKRLQDFLYGELDIGELIPPEPVEDLSKGTNRIWNIPHSAGGRYACSVEKLVYNVVGHTEARQTNDRKALQWKMNIPDTLFCSDRVKMSKSNVVVFLDEYTMISPPLLHKMLHCLDVLFSAPVVLIMGGDQFQLGPVHWDKRSDKKYVDRCGETAPPNAITTNNYYYGSDVRGELKNRLNQEPFEYHMSGSQRCRDDPHLAKFVTYLRNACRKDTSIKAIERRIIAFCRSRGIHSYRYNAFRQGHKTGRLVLKAVDERPENENDLTGEETTAADMASNDENDEDRHLGDDDLRDTTTVQVDWESPPTVDLTPFINFYAKLYDSIYQLYMEGRLQDATLPAYVYKKSAEFARRSFPIFMVKKNDKCNFLSDTFLKTLYNGIHTELREKYQKYQTEDSMGFGVDGETAKRIRLSPKTGHKQSDVETFLKKLCISISVSEESPIQQTLMVGVPYRMTDTLKCVSMPIVSNGELVLLTAIEFEKDNSLKTAFFKTLHRRTSEYFSLRPGLTQNRLNEANGKQITYMLPVVPMVCENIYQMQGNTISSDCFIDLQATKKNDIYVAVSRFKKCESIQGIILPH